jgi:hypothetical protein
MILEIYKRFHGSIESFVLFETLMCVLCFQYINAAEQISIVDAFFSIFAGIYFADLASGCVHLYFDLYTETFQDIGGDFVGHHNSPMSILEVSQFEYIRQSSITLVPLSYLLYNTMCSVSKSRLLCQIVFIYAWRLLQITHRCAHLTQSLSDRDKRQPMYRLMMFLQRYHIILNPSEHHIHHASPKYDVNFCLLNGWANPLFNTIMSVPWIHSRLFP